MAISNSSYKRLLIALVDFVRIYISQVFSCNLASSEDALIGAISCIECIDYPIRDLLSIVRLDCVFWKFAGSV